MFLLELKPSMPQQGYTDRLMEDKLIELQSRLPMYFFSIGGLYLGLVIYLPGSYPPIPETMVTIFLTTSMEL